MITREDIKRGFEKGVVSLGDDPNGNGTVCWIGSGWFYFGGLTAEELSPKEYKEQVPLFDIITEIMVVLDDFNGEPDFQDEYDLYEMILSECREEEKGTLYELLRKHAGHYIEIVEYGDGENFSLEDMDTGEVIFDTDLYELVGKEGRI